MNNFIEIPANKKSIAFRKLKFGVGINDAKYKLTYKHDGKYIHCPYYRAWCDMLKRCYDKNYSIHHPSYTDCIVCPEWLLFSNFKAWMIQQNWVGNELDKDILIQGNKEYSPSTCKFISQRINKLLTNNKSNRGKYLLGVCWCKQKKMFKASCSDGNYQKHLGLFKSEQEAHNAYCSFKAYIILEVANEQDDLQIKAALIKYASIIHLVD